MPEEIIILSDDDSVDEPTVKKRKIEEANGPSEYLLNICTSARVLN